MGAEFKLGPQGPQGSDPKFLYIASTTEVIDADPPRIIVPYAKDEASPTFQAVRLNFEVQGLTPRYYDVSGDDYAYDALFRSLWSQGDPFILVEHDILPYPGAMDALWRCDCTWGAFSYYIFGNLRVQLGCNKFDPTALGECPLPDEPHHWAGLDWEVVTRLSHRWEAGHLHNPPVSHLNAGHRRQHPVDHDPESVTSAFS